MLSNIVGNTVQGEDFFDREHELDRVLERLETDNVLLLAPRRVGKTSLMYRVREKDKELGRLAAYLDLLSAVAKNPEGEPLRVLQSVLGARVQDPEQRDRQLRYLIDVLQSDGYLVLESERYRFRSALLRDFWARRILV